MRMSKYIIIVLCIALFLGCSLPEEDIIQIEITGSDPAHVIIKKETNLHGDINSSYHDYGYITLPFNVEYGVGFEFGQTASCWIQAYSIMPVTITIDLNGVNKYIITDTYVDQTFEIF